MNDRVVRSGGFVSKSHEFYNASIPLAYRDLDIARQALLDDPFWTLVCTDRQLSLANSTDEWRNIADSNPIYEFEYNYDQAHLEATSVMTESLKDIGCSIITTEDLPDTYTKMTTYFTFPWWTCDGFSLKPYFPRINARAYYSAYYKSPGIVEQDVGYGYPIADYPAGWMYPGRPNLGYIFPYVAFANWGFSYNQTCDDLISRMWFQNETGEQEIFNELIDWAQNFQYQCIWMGNDLKGNALNEEWDYTWFWSTFRYTHATYLGPQAQQPIPGFSPAIIFTTSVGAFLGIVFVTIRRKKKSM